MRPRLSRRSLSADLFVALLPGAAAVRTLISFVSSLMVTSCSLVRGKGPVCAVSGSGGVGADDPEMIRGA